MARTHRESTEKGAVTITTRVGMKRSAVRGCWREKRAESIPQILVYLSFFFHIRARGKSRCPSPSTRREVDQVAQQNALDIVAHDGRGCTDQVLLY